jgi:hypothetical protein
VTQPPFPFDAVRDLLGVVRAVYAAARGGGAGRNELSRIAKVGEDLSRALDLAGSTQQGAGAAAIAWRCLDEALVEVGALVDPLTPAAPIVHAARARVAAPRATLRRKPAPR